MKYIKCNTFIIAKQFIFFKIITVTLGLINNYAVIVQTILLH